MLYEDLILLILGGVGGMCIKNAIDIAVLDYKMNEHLDEEKAELCQKC